MVFRKVVLYVDLKQRPHLTLIERLLHAGHYSKYFVHVVSFPLHDNHESGTTSTLT